MINTYNETTLHKKLKELYAKEHNGATEKTIEGTHTIADILLLNGDVIEIQTGAISALKNKIKHLISNGKNITIVRPIAMEKHIEMYDENNNLLYTKKSPKHETVYSVGRGLLGVAMYLTNPRVALEMPIVKIVEKRQKTNSPVQLENRSRRHLKCWIPIDKDLLSIEGKYCYKTVDDYRSLIPQSVPQVFTIKDYMTMISKVDFGYKLSKSDVNSNMKSVKSWVWLLKNIGIIEEHGKLGKAKTYSVL